MKIIHSLYLLIIITNISLAGTYLSGDISYNYISPNKFGITIRTFTWDTTLIDSCSVKIYFGDGDSAIAPRVNGGLSSICPTSHAGITNINIKYSIYYTEHTYAGAGNYFVTSQFLYRNNGLINITSSGNTAPNMVAEIIINPLLGNNNSAINNAAPIVNNTVNIISYYNPTTTDADGDSLYYHIIPASIGYTTPAASTTFNLDSLTGLVTWNKPITSGMYNYDIKITEWRNISGTRYYIGSTVIEVWNQVSGTSSINEFTDNNNINIYPNPSTALFTIISTEKIKQIKIFNPLGEEIKTISNATTIDLTDYTSGVYFLQIKTEKGNTNKKIIKQ